ncbi:MAG TPA: hypothetical protein VF930_06295 [Stellaceae bacterium]
MTAGRAVARAATLAGALSLLFVVAVPVRACELATAPTTRWNVARANGAAWLETPCGERFFSVGVNVVDGGISGARLARPHYDWHASASSLQDWLGQTRERLGAWGFNSAGAWSLPPRSTKPIRRRFFSATGCRFITTRWR